MDKGTCNPQIHKHWYSTNNDDSTASHTGFWKSWLESNPLLESTWMNKEIQASGEFLLGGGGPVEKMQH